MVLVVLTLVVVVGYAVYALVIDDDGGRRRDAAVTEADNGGEVVVPPNEPFVLDLQGSPDAPWSLPQANAGSLAVVNSRVEPDGSVTVTYIPLEVTAGVVVSAERTTGGTPERFEVTIRVVR